MGRSVFDLEIERILRGLILAEDCMHHKQVGGPRNNKDAASIDGRRWEKLGVGYVVDKKSL
jgi:hypothetical protein